MLGISLAAGQGVGVALLLAIFVSNLPEAMGSADDMRKAGPIREPRSCACGSSSRRSAPIATVVGYAAADAVTGNLRAAIDGFAAGALLVMLIDSMIPDARKDAGRAAGLVTVLGFALAAGLSAS